MTFRKMSLMLINHLEKMTEPEKSVADIGAIAV
jgi:hypothetical protein